MSCFFIKSHHVVHLRIESTTYENGHLEKIQHTDNKTGDTHEHNVERGGLIGAFGPYTGSKK